MNGNENTIKEKSFLPLLLIVSQIFLVIILVFIISSFTHDEKISEIDYDRQPKITIDGLESTLSDPSSDYIDLLEQKLAKAVKSNSGDYDAASSTAVIRDGSFKIVNLNKDNVVFYSMIVDIPNLEQSYQIYDHYSGGREPANRMYVLCLDEESENVYSDFDCKSDYPSDTRMNIVAHYIGYFNFETFHAYADDENKEVIHIVPHTLHPSASDKEEYIARVKEAINSLGVSSDLFEYRVDDPGNLG